MDPLKAAPVVFPQPRSLTQDGKGIIQVVWPHLAWQDIPQQSKYPNHIPRLPIVDENQTLFIRKDDPKSIRSRRFVVVSTNRFDGLIPRWTMGLACTKATISSNCVIMESKVCRKTEPGSFFFRSCVSIPKARPACSIRKEVFTSPLCWVQIRRIKRWQ